jgi:hypothetical protein
MPEQDGTTGTRTMSGPLDIFLSTSLYTLVYRTSTPYEHIGKATVLYSCFVPAVETPLADLASQPIREAQNVAVASAFF